MSTEADLPASARIMGNPSGNGGYSGGFDPAGREEQITWAVTWEDRFAFEEAVQGYEVTVPVGTGSITRRIPLQSPYNPRMYAVGGGRFKCQGKENTSAARPYNTVIFTINFGYLPYGVDGDSPFQQLQEQGSNRSITQPNRRYTFTNGEVVDHGVAITHPGVGFSYTLFKVPSLTAFRSIILSLMTTPVNSGALTIAGTTFAAGTILLDTYGTTTAESMFGVTENTATINLLWSALPWNQLVRSDGVFDTLSPAPYSTGNLSALVS